jgi:hypothetical protein
MPLASEGNGGIEYRRQPRRQSFQEIGQRRIAQDLRTMIEHLRRPAERRILSQSARDVEQPPQTKLEPSLFRRLHLLQAQRPACLGPSAYMALRQRVEKGARRAAVIVPDHLLLPIDEGHQHIARRQGFGLG